MKSKEKPIYLITMGGEYELPVFAGSAKECAAMLNLTVASIYRLAKTRDASSAGFKVEKIPVYPAEFILCEMMCPGPEED